MADRKLIYFAGGCFWGTEQYMASVHGVTDTEVGYANGVTEHPTYGQVCQGDTGYAETVKVTYDPAAVQLEFLLELYYEAIDPLAVNRQGNDRGTQYRTGIYFVDPADEPILRASLARLKNRLGQRAAIECVPLKSYHRAEEYHQKYLDKNPGGYCHISREKIALAAQALVDPSKYEAPGKRRLRDVLTPEQYQVTQESATEPPFQNEYWNQYRPGAYVDVTTGEPLFLSNDKFESGCGWPSFSAPIDPSVLREFHDASLGTVRTEVRSRVGNAHLGHVFTDGPAEAGGLRYCINSAALRFVPLEDMQAEGYGWLAPHVK